MVRRGVWHLGTLGRVTLSPARFERPVEQRDRHERVCVAEAKWSASRASRLTRDADAWAMRSGRAPLRERLCGIAAGQCATKGQV